MTDKYTIQRQKQNSTTNFLYSVAQQGDYNASFQTVFMKQRAAAKPYK